jgi:hypothetical protein
LENLEKNDKRKSISKKSKFSAIFSFDSPLESFVNSDKVPMNLNNDLVLEQDEY